MPPKGLGSGLGPRPSKGPAGLGGSQGGLPARRPKGGDEGAGSSLALPTKRQKQPQTTVEKLKAALGDDDDVERWLLAIRMDELVPPPADQHLSDAYIIGHEKEIALRMMESSGRESDADSDGFESPMEDEPEAASAGGEPSLPPRGKKGSKSGGPDSDPFSFLGSGGGPSDMGGALAAIMGGDGGGKSDPLSAMMSAMGAGGGGGDGGMGGLMQMAGQMMQNPGMQQMMSQMIGGAGGAGGMGGFPFTQPPQQQKAPKPLPQLLKESLPQEEVHRWMSMILTDVRSGEQERSPQLQTGNSRSFSLAYGCGWPQQKKAGGLLGGLFAKGG